MCCGCVSLVCAVCVRENTLTFLNTWPSLPSISPHAPPVDDFFLLNESLRISCPADDGRFSIVGDGGAARGRRGRGGLALLRLPKREHARH